MRCFVCGICRFCANRKSSRRGPEAVVEPRDLVSRLGQKGELFPDNIMGAFVSASFRYKRPIILYPFEPAFSLLPIGYCWCCSPGPLQLVAAQPRVLVIPPRLTRCTNILSTC